MALAASSPSSWPLRLLPLMGLWSIAWRLLAQLLAQRCRAIAQKIRWAETLHQVLTCATGYLPMVPTSAPRHRRSCA